MPTRISVGHPLPAITALPPGRCAETADPLYSHLPRFNLTRRATRFFSEDLRASLAGYDALQELRERLPAAV